MFRVRCHGDPTCIARKDESCVIRDKVMSHTRGTQWDVPLCSSAARSHFRSTSRRTSRTSFVGCGLVVWAASNMRSFTMQLYRSYEPSCTHHTRMFECCIVTAHTYIYCLNATLHDRMSTLRGYVPELVSQQKSSTIVISHTFRALDLWCIRRTSPLRLFFGRACISCRGDRGVV